MKYIIVAIHLLGTSLYAGECQISHQSRLGNLDKILFDNGQVYIEVSTAQDCFSLAYSALGKPVKVVDYGLSALNSRGIGVYDVKTSNKYVATYLTADAKVEILVQK